MQFMLDTDTCSFIIKKVPSALAAALKHKGDWCISSVVYEELAFGLIASRGTRLEPGYEAFLRTVPVVEFTKSDALASADIRAHNFKRGHNIGLADNQIAGHAANTGLVLVSNNLKHLKPINGLEVVSWV
ncbi:MAG: hypothetical protein RJA35_1474 [Actinomycetota bacterium]|jgi:tRNA(fMet)-specific endonuclease VapC